MRQTDKEIHIEEILQMLDVSLDYTKEFEADWQKYKYESLQKPLMKLSKHELYTLKIAIRDLRTFMRTQR